MNKMIITISIMLMSLTLNARFKIQRQLKSLLYNTYQQKTVCI